MCPSEKGHIASRHACQHTRGLLAQSAPGSGDIGTSHVQLYHLIHQGAAVSVAKFKEDCFDTNQSQIWLECITPAKRNSLAVIVKSVRQIVPLDAAQARTAATSKQEQYGTCDIAEKLHSQQQLMSRMQPETAGEVFERLACPQGV